MYRANAIETSTHARCAFSRSDASVVSGHDLPAVELPQFRQVGDELAGGRLTDARHAAHQVALVLPVIVRFDQLCDAAVQVLALLLQAALLTRQSRCDETR